MKRFLGCALITLCVSTVGVQAAEFKPYPHAKPDEAAAAAASKVQVGTEVQVYMTNDGFDKVYAFYKNLYKEYAMPAKPPKLESGQAVQWAFFIIDGGTDLKSSQHWIKIQRPMVGSTKFVGGKMVLSDVRDLSVIEVVHKK